MKAIFLGTNGWYDTDTGNTICILLKADGFSIILDAGNGIYKADQYIDASNPVHLFLSHFHLDHIEGLHILNKFRFKKGLGIYGPAGTQKTLDTIVNYPFTLPLKKLPFPVEVHELLPGHHNVPFSFECRELVHPCGSMGYRFDLDGKVIAYCPDTGICQNAIELAKDADLLMAECSLRPGERNPMWPHLNPEDAVEIAQKAGAKRLALVHFDANRYRSIQERLWIQDLMSDFHDLIVAVDGMALDV
ncbi:MAG TPA: MBL fold metallo-hydrolase [Methanotrichaceae archaeon]|nr:MBL fold metallo-hydrolase [Methanotrichaceae archaeon]